MPYRDGWKKSSINWWGLRSASATAAHHCQLQKSRSSSISAAGVGKQCTRCAEDLTAAANQEDLVSLSDGYQYVALDEDQCSIFINTDTLPQHPSDLLPALPSTAVINQGWVERILVCHCVMVDPLSWSPSAVW